MQITLPLMTLVLAIGLRSCPGFHLAGKEPSLRSYIEVQRLEADSISLLDCRDVSVEVTLHTTVPGFEDLGDYIHHQNVHLSSLSTGPITLKKISDTIYQATALPPSDYQLDYTLFIDSMFPIVTLRGQSLTLRESFTVGDPSHENLLKFHVKNASCDTCRDGTLFVEWLADEPEEFWWSTGEITPEIRGLVPGSYEIIVPRIGNVTCHFMRSVQVETNNELIVDATLDLTTCDPQRVTPSYSLVCDSLGMEGVTGGTIDFDLGKFQFAELDLDHIIQLDLGIRNWKGDSWQTIYRLGSSNNVLSEGNVVFPATSGALEVVSLRLPLIDFVTAGGFDIDLSFRLHVSDNMSIQSLAWKVLNDGAVNLRVKPSAWLQAGTICKQDSVFLGSIFEVSGGSTPYRYSWDLDGDSIFEVRLIDNPLLHITTDTTIRVGVELKDANGALAYSYQNLTISESTMVTLQIEDLDKSFRDTVIITQLNADPISIQSRPELPLSGSGLIAPNVFDPIEAGVGLHTLSVDAQNPCIEAAYLHIVVLDGFDPSWSPSRLVDSLHCGDTVFLKDLIIGDSGGIWWRNDTILDPPIIVADEALSDSIPLTYGIGLDSSNFQNGWLTLDCSVTSTSSAAVLNIHWYPNPAKESLNLSCQGHQNYQLTVHSLDGLCQGLYENLSCNASIDVSGLKSGIYLLHFFSSEINTVHRLVKL